MSIFNISGNSQSTLNNLSILESYAQKSLEKLSSGLKINRAADDPAGLAISERLRSEVREMNRASMNAMDEMGMIQTADAAMGEIHNAVQNIHELSVQANSSVLTADDRAAIQAEIDANVEHIDSVAQNAEFNSKPLLDGSLGAQVSSQSLGLSGIDVISEGSAASVISQASEAIRQVSEFRGQLGAQQNSLESNMRAMDIAAENTLAAESRIRDLDYAQEMTEFTRTQIMADVSMAALAQANVQAKAAFSLLSM